MADLRDARPDPDALLAAVQQEKPDKRLGLLKIFFGAAPGVGKTYAMLEAARKEAKSGVDVVVGYVEPHVRPETQALLLGLEMLPRRAVEHRGSTLYEFDLSAALARKPRLIVVDELAHTNAPQSQHAKRWQDVRTLLDNGIDVFTTLNVQHLESVNDVVAKITGVVVRETVPDAVFDEAYEVELVDLPPEDLLDRLKEGRVYVRDQAARAVDHFFRKANLLALRELALRKTADRVNVQVEGYRKARGETPTWATTEKLLVCVGPSPLSARLIRSTYRMAIGLRCSWIAAHVDAAATSAEPHRRQLHFNLQLAEQLGARIEMLAGEDAVAEILSFARANNVTKIIIGKPLRPRWRERLFGSFVYGLIRQCGDIDVYVISGDAETPTTRTESPRRAAVDWEGYWVAAAVVAACTLVGFFLARRIEPVNLVMIYLLGVVGVSLRYGRGPSGLAALLGVMAFDFCFVPPVLTFVVEDTQYLITFAAMLATGLIVSTLVGRVRQQMNSARRRERRTAAQFALSRQLAVARTLPEVAAAIERAALDAFDAVARTIDVRAVAPAADDNKPLSDVDAVAHWVLAHRERAGLSTGTLPGADSLYLPLIAGDAVLGALRIKPRTGNPFDDPAQMQLAEAFADQAAAALERLRLVAEAERIEIDVEAERLRNALLSSVSHDLRTPLAAIAGAASALLEGQGKLDESTRRELLMNVVDESAALNRLVGNLLDATRIEAGAIAVHREWQSIEELIGAALNRLERRLARHRVAIAAPADLPLVRGDGILLQQVLVNLLENAVKYCPAGSEIEISASGSTADLASSGEQKFVTVAVADRGPGLPAGAEAAIFEKFERVGKSNDRDGFGLGLSICRGIVQLHGGRIWAENRAGGGAIFRFTLPIESLADRSPLQVESDAT